MCKRAFSIRRDLIRRQLQHDQQINVSTRQPQQETKALTETEALGSKNLSIESSQFLRRTKSLHHQQKLKLRGHAVCIMCGSILVRGVEKFSSGQLQHFRKTADIPTTIFIHTHTRSLSSQSLVFFHNSYYSRILSLTHMLSSLLLPFFFVPRTLSILKHCIVFLLNKLSNTDLITNM